MPMKGCLRAISKVPMCDEYKFILPSVGGLGLKRSKPLINHPHINDVVSHDVLSLKMMSLGCYMGPLIVLQVSLR